MSEDLLATDPACAGEAGRRPACASPVIGIARAADAGAWTAVGPLASIPRLGARVLRTALHGDIAIFRTADDAVFALLDRCPHKGGPLSQGIVFGDKVACPLHGWTIGLCDGEAVAPDQGCARRFEARVEAGHVMVLI